MPSGIQRSRANAAKDASLGLKGWDAIQEYMLSHDEDMIRDIADDIDTLLVFAGLFSAVLTAFIVGSITMLQPDTSQVSLQVLSLIALNTGAPEEMRPFLNSTASSLPTSTSFQAAASSVAINTLWFMSLVLSLASALFGMLAKQWCREYLRWHSAITPSRENVLLRQVRYEAWQSWSVSSYIASIPAVLEVAVILFLVGLMIFVWTLERSVAAMVTIIAGTCLLLMFIATILAAFSRLCPFKSPVGLAIARLVDIILRAKAPGLPLDLAHISYVAPPLPKTWGSRDKEVVYVQATQTIPYHPKYIHDVLPREDLDAFQASLLLRALVWARRGNDDVRVARSIEESLLSIHDTDIGGLARDAMVTGPYIQSLHSLCLCAGFILDSSALKGILDRLYTFLPTANGSHIFDFDFRAELLVCLPERKPMVHDRKGPYFFGIPGVDRTWSRLGDPNTVQMARKALYHTLTRIVDHWVLMPDGKNHPSPEAAHLPLYVTEILCMLRYIPPATYFVDLYSYGSLEVPSADTKEWAACLASAFHKLKFRRDACLSGVTSLVAFLLDGMEILGSVLNSNYRARDEFFLEKDERSARYAVILHEGSGWKFGRHLFVIAASRAIRILEHHIKLQRKPSQFGPWPSFSHDDRRLRSWRNSDCGDLVRAMTECATLSLESMEKDCGALVPLPWIADLLSVYRTAVLYRWSTSVFPFTSGAVRPEFFRLLYILDQSVRADLVSGRDVVTQLEDLLDLTGRTELPTVLSGRSFVRERVHRQAAGNLDSFSIWSSDEENLDLPTEESTDQDSSTCTSRTEVAIDHPVVANPVSLAHANSRRVSISEPVSSAASGSRLQSSRVDSARQQGPQGLHTLAPTHPRGTNSPSVTRTTTTAPWPTPTDDRFSFQDANNDERYTRAPSTSAQIRVTTSPAAASAAWACDGYEPQALSGVASVHSDEGSELSLQEMADREDGSERG